MSESAATDLLQQVRWRDGVYCPRCRSDRTVRNGSYRAYQRYLCSGCGRTFNNKTGTIFAHSKLSLTELYFTIYVYLRFNTSIRQIKAELDVSYRTESASSALPERLTRHRYKLSGPVEIDELYVSAGVKGRERDGHESRSRGPFTRGRSSFAPIFTIVDRDADQGYIVPAKSTDESTVRLLLEDHGEESLTVYTDGFRAYDPLEDDDNYDRKYVVHGDGGYVDGDVHVNECESHAPVARRWLSPHRGISKTRPTLYFRALHLQRDLYRKPREEALKHALDAAL